MKCLLMLSAMLIIGVECYGMQDYEADGFGEEMDGDSDDDGPTDGDVYSAPALGPNSDGNSMQGNGGESDYSDDNGSWIGEQSGWSYQEPQQYYPVRPYGPSQGYSSGFQQPAYADPPPAPIRYSNLPIKISCPADVDGVCRYELVSASGRSYPYSIGAGQEQGLKETTSWTIRYEPGPGRARKTYKLRGGKSYSLQRGEDGLWQVYLAR